MAEADSRARALPKGLDTNDFPFNLKEFLFYIQIFHKLIKRGEVHCSLAVVDSQ